MPTVVSTTSSNKNQLMIQNESGFAASERRNFDGEFVGVYAASAISATVITVGTSATMTSKTSRKMQNAIETTQKIFSRLSRSFVNRPSASMLMLKYGITIKRQHDQRGHQHSGNYRWKVVQQFLQSEKVPGRLGRIRRVRRIRQPF